MPCTYFRRAAAVVLALVPTSLLLAQSAAGQGDSFAFLVGCGAYDPNELRKLPYSVAEMTDFRDTLLKTGFPAENIKFLHDRQQVRFIPEKAKVLRELALLLNRVGPRDTLVVALSGHGLHFKGDKTGYFCPLDARPADRTTLIPLEGEGGLFELIKGCKARRKLLIVNACRNDPPSDLSLATQKLDLDDEYPEQVPEGIAAIYSCRKGEKSYYYDENDERTRGRRRSLFFHHLIEAWQGHYAGSGEKVTLDHVFDQVTRKTAAEADLLFARPQVPDVKRQYEGEWVLAVPAPGAYRINPPAAALPLFRAFDPNARPFYQEVQTRTTQLMKVMGQDVKQEQDQTVYIKWTPRQKAGDDYVVEQQVVGVKVNIEIIGGKNIAFDSTRPDGNQPKSAMTDFFNALLKQKFTFTISPKLEIKKIEGRDEFIKNVAETNPATKTLLDAILSENAMKKMSEPTWWAVPTGDSRSWTKKSTADLGPIGTYNTTFNFTREGESGGMEKIRIDTRMEYTEPRDRTGLAFTIKSARLKSTAGSGEAVFDRNKGRIESSKLTMRLEGDLTVEVGNAVTDIRLIQDQTSITRTFDANPLGGSR